MENLTRRYRHEYIVVNLGEYPENVWKIHWDENVNQHSGILNYDKKHDGYAVEACGSGVPDYEKIRYGDSVMSYLEEHGMDWEEIQDVIIFWRKKK